MIPLLATVRSDAAVERYDEHWADVSFSAPLEHDTLDRSINQLTVEEHGSPSFVESFYDLDGSTDYLVVFHSHAFAFGSSPFTVEFSMRADSSAKTNYRVPLGSAESWYFQATSEGRLNFAHVSTYLTQPNVDVFDSELHHIAVAYDGTTLRHFIDGEVKATASGIAFVAPSLCFIGAYSTGPWRYWFGRLRRIRITKGVARYIENFVPPAQAFPTQGPPT